MEIISRKEYKAILNMIGVTYLGHIKQSAKMRYSFAKGTMTYCLYLAPFNMSGYQVCPYGQFCKDNCLNGSGQNKADMLARGQYSKINISRIKKTRFFFQNRELFMKAMCYEIVTSAMLAKENGMKFSVRLNGTSDLSPLAFYLGGKNILELFPTIQFYDYSKVPSRMVLPQKYANYDVTFSFDGYNWDLCEQWLERGGKVAVVFENEKTLPLYYKGYPIHDANGYDMRYEDPARHIMGLHYHRTANDYKNGKYIRPTTPFIIKEDDTDCIWHD